MCSVKRLTLTASGVALLALVLAAARPAQYGGRFGSRVPGIGGTLNHRFPSHVLFGVSLFWR